MNRRLCQNLQRFKIPFTHTIQPYEKYKNRIRSFNDNFYESSVSSMLKYLTYTTNKSNNTRGSNIGLPKRNNAIGLGLLKDGQAIFKRFAEPLNRLFWHPRRCSSGREKCFKDKLPRQLPTPCDLIKQDKPKVSMWQDPDCCRKPPEFIPRYDQLYWKPSDIRKKKFPRTWSECSVLKITEKDLCCYERHDICPMERRDRSYFKKKAESACGKIARKPCLKEKCPKLKPPCYPCHAVGCQKRLKKPKCKKYCTPLPSYTESRMFRAKERNTECKCLVPESFCKTV